jgi:hypothetical protein
LRRCGCVERGRKAACGLRLERRRCQGQGGLKNEHGEEGTQRQRRRGINSLSGNPKSTEGTQRTGCWREMPVRSRAHPTNASGASSRCKTVLCIHLVKCIFPRLRKNKTAEGRCRCARERTLRTQAGASSRCTTLLCVHLVKYIRLRQPDGYSFQSWNTDQLCREIKLPAHQPARAEIFPLDSAVKR